MTEKRYPDPTKRLESWKAIANYLNRSVRTVRRWEQDEGLPVHRHRHTTGCSVFAFTTELDAWRADHRQATQNAPDSAVSPPTSTATQTAAPARPPSRSQPSWGIYATIALTGLIIVGLGLQLTRMEPRVATGITAPAEPKWALVANVENRTGVAAFDTALASSLRRAVTKSGTHRNLPPDRIDRALRLTRRAPNALITPELARIIGLRDGHVELLLVPRAEQRGKTFLLAVDIINPVDGSPVFCETIELDNVERHAQAVNQLVHDVTGALPQASAEVAGQPRPSLAAVTTDSMEALRHYQRALEAIRQEEPEASQTSLQLAIEEDADFASATALKGWVLREAGRPSSEYLPLVTAATAHVSTLMPEERYFIKGLHEHLSGDAEHAAASYRALLRLAPSHSVGARANLALCLETRSSNQCVGQRLRLADLHPDDFRSNIEAAWAMAAEAGRVHDANAYAERALSILGDDGSPYSAINVARAHLFPVIAAWVDGDLDQALEASQRLRARLPQFSRKVQDIVAEYLGEVSLAMGRLHEADALFGLVSQPAKRHELHASTLYALQDDSALREHLVAASTFNQPLTALLLADAGLYDDAVTLLQNNARNRMMTDAQAGVVRAKIALIRGKVASAQAELRQATSTLTPTDRALYFVGPDLLARTLEAEGRLHDALSILEMTSFRRSQAGYHGAGMFWLMCQHHLAGLYREVGRETEAAELEDLLRQTLRHADQHHPLRQALSATRGT